MGPIPSEPDPRSEPAMRQSAQGENTTKTSGFAAAGWEFVFFEERVSAGPQK
jgi:hypothetical protein